MQDDPRATLIAESWVRSAAAWTQVVREGLIPSRKAGTDAAIVTAGATLPAGPWNGIVGNVALLGEAV